MGRKLSAKAAALAAAQGSGAVFEALAEDPAPKAATPSHDRNEPGVDDAPVANQNKEPKTMNAQTFAPAIDAAAEKMRNMMNGAGAPFDAKAFDGAQMMERTSKLAQDAAELARANLEAMAASARIAAQNAGTLTQDVAAVGRKSFEGASEAMKGFAEAKSPTELLRLQGEFAKSYFETMMAEGARVGETFVKLAGEALQPVQSQMAANVEKAKELAK